MPADMRKYPPNWKTFSQWVRYTRANRQCECTGQCGMHRQGFHAHRCVERHHTKARFARGTIRLTVAHLCSCDPPCTEPGHVIAACQKCHLAIDMQLHLRTRRETRRRRMRTLGFNLLPFEPGELDSNPRPEAPKAPNAAATDSDYPWCLPPDVD